MPKAARTPESAAGDATQRPAGRFKKQRFTVFLITGDDSLWPLIGADLSGDLILKQLDSIEELLATVPAGQAGIVLWDAREHADAAATLSALALHSSRFALLVLDSTSNAGVWTLPLHHRQIVANVGLPLSSAVLGKALESAREEVNARLALLGDSSAGPDAGGPAEAVNKTRWLPAAIAAAIVAAAAAAWVLTHHGGASQWPGYGAKDTAPAAPMMAEPPAPAGGAAAADEKVDGLIENAQQAMLNRHYIDPAAGSALELYRVALLIDPSNGEARQGLARLAEILIARVESALDERKFDVALQSLETARSIDANDHRLSALDERIAGLRAELGPAQITAAVNAQNFDRATQLIEDAARAKSLPPAKLAQLRDDVRKRREEFDSQRLLKLAETRPQQGKPAEPRNQIAPEAAVPAKPEQPQDLDLAESRLAQGKLLEPDNDNARTALDAGDAAAADSKAAAESRAAVESKGAVESKSEAGAAPVVAERSLTRLNTLQIAYPYRAQAANVEGWVEIGFTVNADGSVGNVAVLNASPPRTFEQAGLRAVSKLRYQPVVQDGKAVAVTSQIRVVFRLPK